MPRFASRAPHAALHGPPCAVTRPPLTRQPIYPRAAGGTAPRFQRVGASAAAMPSRYSGRRRALRRFSGRPLNRAARRTPFPQYKAMPRSALHVSRPCFPLEIFTICIFSEIYYILSIKREPSPIETAPFPHARPRLPDAMPRLPDAGQNTGDRAGRALPSGLSPRALSQYIPPALPGCTG